MLVLQRLNFQRCSADSSCLYSPPQLRGTVYFPKPALLSVVFSVTLWPQSHPSWDIFFLSHWSFFILKTLPAKVVPHSTSFYVNGRASVNIFRCWIWWPEETHVNTLCTRAFILLLCHEHQWQTSIPSYICTHFQQKFYFSRPSPCVMAIN